MGEIFGKYSLERKLAVGGMAEIFLATYVGPEGFKKNVAIKRILPNLTEDSDFVTMFLDEARLVARFSHPNIVQIFELGQVKGTYFVAMEYVHGLSTSRVLKECKKKNTRLPHEYAAKIISFACEGLEYAHSFTDADGTPLNLIHRDVSPQNLMLTYDGVVKVLDFGIAKAARNLYQTRTSTLKGKAAYMSPEQISLKHGLDRRSDIFALGIVLYEFITGQRPFNGETELEIMLSIVQQEPAHPQILQPDIPDELCAILQKALAKDRDKRYQTCRELRSDLEQFLINRKILVDSYTLGAFLRELVPPGDLGVGYSLPTPSRPELAKPGDGSGSKPKVVRSGRTPPRAPADKGENAPTVLTPSEMFRLSQGIEKARPADAAAVTSPVPPPAAKRGGSQPKQRAPSIPHRGGRQNLVLAASILGLFVLIGVGGAYLLFGPQPVEPARPVLADAGPPPAEEPSPPPDAGGTPGLAADAAAPPPEPADAGAEPPADPGPALPVKPEAPDTGPRRNLTAEERRQQREEDRRRREEEKRKADEERRRKEDEERRLAMSQVGFLKIDSRPWTEVTIDGVSYGQTPLGMGADEKGIPLSAGPHKMELSNKRFGIDFRQTVQVLPGKSQTVNKVFGQGTLKLFVLPYGDVYVNGTMVGSTPLENPLQLYEGVHTVRVFCKQTGKEESRKVNIVAGQALTLNIDLR